MVEKTNKEILQELYQAVVGIPESPDENGLIGDIAEVKELLQKQNSRVRKNEQRISKIWGILIGVSVLGGSGIGLAIKDFFGG